MSYGRPETLTYLLYTCNLLFDRDGSNIQILLSLLAFNIVISNCPLIRFFVETSPQIRLVSGFLSNRSVTFKFRLFNNNHILQQLDDNTLLTVTNSRAENVGSSSLVSITLS